MLRCLPLHRQCAHRWRWAWVHCLSFSTSCPYSRFNRIRTAAVRSSRRHLSSSPTVPPSFSSPPVDFSNVPFSLLLARHLSQQPEAVLRFLLSQQPEQLPTSVLNNLFVACQRHGLQSLAVELLSLLLSRRSPHVRGFHLTVTLSICQKQRRRSEAERVFSSSVAAAYLPPATFPASSVPPASSTLVPTIDSYNLLLQLLMQEAHATIRSLPRPAYIAQVRSAYAAALSLAGWMMASPLLPVSSPSSSKPSPLAFDQFTYSHLTSLYSRCWQYTGLSAVVERIAAQQLQPSVPVCGSVMQAMHEAQHWEAVLLWFSQALEAEPSEPRGRRVSSEICCLAIQAAYQLGRCEEAVSFHRLMQARQLQLDSRSSYEQLMSAYRQLGQEDMALQLQQEAEGRGLQLHTKPEAEQPVSQQGQQRQQRQQHSGSQARVSFAELLVQLPHHPDGIVKALRRGGVKLTAARLHSFFSKCLEYGLLAPAAELLSFLVQRQSPLLRAAHLARVLAICYKLAQCCEGVRIFSCSVPAAYVPPALSASVSGEPSSGWLLPDIRSYNFLLQLLINQAAEAAVTVEASVEQRAAYAAPLSLAAWLMSSPLFFVQPAPPADPSPLAFDAFTYSQLVMLSARCRMESLLSELLERLQAQRLQPTYVLCGSICHGLHQAGRYQETLHWFSRALQAEAAAGSGEPGVDSGTCSIAIHAAAKLGLHLDAVATHRYMQSRGLRLTNGPVIAKLIIAYSHLGHEARAQQLLREAKQNGIMLQQEVVRKALASGQRLAPDRKRQHALGTAHSAESKQSGGSGKLVSGLYLT